MKPKITYICVQELPYHEPYGFQFWAEDENGTLCTDTPAYIYVPFSHFERYLLDVFQQVYFEQENEDFDVMATHFFNLSSVQNITHRLNQKHFYGPNEQDFIQNIIDWLSQKSQSADTIVVNGTL